MGVFGEGVDAVGVQRVKQLAVLQAELFRTRACASFNGRRHRFDPLYTVIWVHFQDCYKNKEFNMIADYYFYVMA